MYNRHFVGVAAILSAGSDMLRAGKAVRQAILDDDPPRSASGVRRSTRSRNPWTKSSRPPKKTLATDAAKASMKLRCASCSASGTSLDHIVELALAGRKDEAAGTRRRDGNAVAMSDGSSMRKQSCRSASRPTIEARDLRPEPHPHDRALVLLGAGFGIAIGFWIARMIATPLGRRSKSPSWSPPATSRARSPWSPRTKSAR